MLRRDLVCMQSCQSIHCSLTYTKWVCLWHLLSVNAQTSLSMRAVSPEPSLLSHMHKMGVHLVYPSSSIGPTIGSMTSRRQIQDGGPHDFRSKMAAPTTPRWRPPRRQIQDGGPHEIRYEMAAPVTRSVTPRRVSQRPRPLEGSVTS